MASGSRLEQARIGICRKVAAVEVDGKLDFGLVGVAGEGRRSDW